MFCLTDPTLTEHLEIFGIGLWFTMPSSLTATSRGLGMLGDISFHCSSAQHIYLIIEVTGSEVASA